LEVFYTSACRVNSGSLAFTPAPLLLVESLTPSPLEMKLSHQALVFFEWAFCHPADNFPLWASATQTKERALFAIFLLITGKPKPQRKYDLMPIHFPLGPPNFTVSTFIEGCSRSDSGQPDAAAEFL